MTYKLSLTFIAALVLSSSSSPLFAQQKSAGGMIAVTVLMPSSAESHITIQRRGRERAYSIVLPANAATAENLGTAVAALTKKLRETGYDSFTTLKVPVRNATSVATQNRSIRDLKQSRERLSDGLRARSTIIYIRRPQETSAP